MQYHTEHRGVAVTFTACSQGHCAPWGSGGLTSPVERRWSSSEAGSKQEKWGGC